MDAGLYPPSAEDTRLNVFVKLLPNVFTTATMAIEIPAAIRPYSIAVAPDSFFKNARAADIGRLQVRRGLWNLGSQELQFSIGSDYALYKRKAAFSS